MNETMLILTHEKKHKRHFKNKKAKSILFEVTISNCSAFSQNSKDLSHSELR